MIEVERLTKQYSSLIAVRDLTFTVSQGAVSGLLGSNGAGKTTTLRMLAGVLGPTHGNIRLCGYDLLKQPLAARRCLGYLPETSPLYQDLTVRQYLDYRSELKGITNPRRKVTLEAAEKTGCHSVLDVRISKLSRGYRQRVGIADVLLADPSIILLDEPTAGLDPNQVRDLRDLVLQLREGHAIVISTHVLSEVDALCTHALVMHEGRLVVNDTIDSLRSRNNDTEVELQLSDPEHRAAVILADLKWTICEDRTLLVSSGGAPELTRASEIRARPTGPCANIEGAIERLVAALVEGGIGVHRVGRATSSLQSVFASLTQTERVAR